MEIEKFPLPPPLTLLKDNGIRISMDGKSCWRDNVFVERLWRSLKYDGVYLHAYDCVSSAREGMERYSRFYNQKRPHTALDGRTPDGVYFDNLPALFKQRRQKTARLHLRNGNFCPV